MHTETISAPVLKCSIHNHLLEPTSVVEESPMVSYFFGIIFLHAVEQNLLALKFFDFLDEAVLMNIPNLGVTLRDNCYSSGDSLFELTGSDVTISQCITACVVRA